MYTTEARLQNVGLRHMTANVSKDCALCTRKAIALQPGGMITLWASVDRVSNVCIAVCICV